MPSTARFNWFNVDDRRAICLRGRRESSSSLSTSVPAFSCDCVQSFWAAGCAFDECLASSPFFHRNPPAFRFCHGTDCIRCPADENALKLRGRTRSYSATRAVTCAVSLHGRKYPGPPGPKANPSGDRALHDRDAGQPRRRRRQVGPALLPAQSVTQRHPRAKFPTRETGSVELVRPKRGRALDPMIIPG